MVGLNAFSGWVGLPSWCGIYICVYVYMYVYTCMCVCVCVCVYICIWVYVYVCMYMCVCMCMYIYIYIYMQYTFPVLIIGICTEFPLKAIGWVSLRTIVYSSSVRGFG